ncbi:hypothetical protein [Brachybacterium sp. ACRRE]|uniref:hypothetical protein n=1 Tax=Brachybacterium sp. ACRRE TaxID=2918184 RepID=UPI001EF39D01|nr:hypothetical protein [Brachybacterium sp. ACRRE]MCG7309069.1 hypothetical protein [Brachybacterium sp. ACRRE]
MSIDTTQHDISRGSFLRGALAAAGGIAGIGAATAAGAAPAGTSPAKADGDFTVPESWDQTVFGTGLGNGKKVYIDGLSVLYQEGTPTTLSEKEVEAQFADTLPRGAKEGEIFTAKSTGSLSLDGSSVLVRLNGDKGTRVNAEAYLVRTANPKAHGVITKIDVPHVTPLYLPQKAHLAWSTTRIDDPASVSTKEAREQLGNALAWCYQTNGEPQVDTKDVKVFDDGVHITGYARWIPDVGLGFQPYYGIALPTASGWSYLFSRLPGK